jgi:hypothetical protein
MLTQWGQVRKCLLKSKMEVYILYKRVWSGQRTGSRNRRGRHFKWSGSRIFWHQKALVIKDQWILKISCVKPMSGIYPFVTKLDTKWLKAGVHWQKHYWYGSTISPYLLALATLGGTAQIKSFLLFDNNLRIRYSLLWNTLYYSLN